MNTSAIVCTLLAGTLGFGSVASAQDWRGRQDRDTRWEQRQERQERREARQQWQQQRRHDAWNNGYRAGQAVPNDRYVQPNHGYVQPGYVARYNRGGYLPREYRHSGYYVNNWNAYPGLYAPPSGHQWMHVGSDFLLVALATGLIANLVR